jgi:hypothetical protein
MEMSKHLCRMALVGLVALAMVAGASSAVGAQQQADKGSAWQLKIFDEFLDQHPNIAQDINKNPNVVNDQNYLSKQPELKQFLDQHPDLKDRLQDNPGAFMRQDRAADKNEPGATDYQLKTFDEFLERHPNIRQDANKNPNVLKDPDYIARHPDLKQFLDQHPDLKDKLLDNPSSFLQGSEKSEGKATRYQLQAFDQFLDQHQNIAQDLSKNPNLVNDPNYISKHPELDRFLKQHPDLKDRLQDNPAEFMQQGRGVEKNEQHH